MRAVGFEGKHTPLTLQHFSNAALFTRVAADTQISASINLALRTQMMLHEEGKSVYAVICGYLGKLLSVHQTMND